MNFNIKRDILGRFAKAEEGYTIAAGRTKHNAIAVVKTAGEILNDHKASPGRNTQSIASKQLANSSKIKKETSNEKNDIRSKAISAKQIGANATHARQTEKDGKYRKGNTQK